MRNYNKSTYVIAGVAIAVLLVAFLVIKNVIIPLLVHYDTSSTIKEAANNKSVEEIKVFNLEFEKYTEEEQTGKEVKELINKVIEKNKNDEKINLSYLGVTYEGLSELDMVSDQISEMRLYKIECDKDDNGKINKINIIDVEL